LKLVIQNFQSGKILNSFRTLEKDTISFKNTPIIQDGGNSIYTANAERNLEKTKQLLRKMLNGEAVITGIINQKGQHEITVGRRCYWSRAYSYSNTWIWLFMD
jgi:hypothetical protein